jgi:GxxExxY protein
LKTNELTESIIGSAIEVHQELGPGLLESTYEACLFFELSEKGLFVERQKSLPVRYKSKNIDCGYRIDLLINDKIIVELKTVEKIAPVHEAQLLSYLKMSNHQVGLLINFNTMYLKNGIKRIVNNFHGH